MRAAIDCRGEHRHPVFDGGRGRAGQLLDAVELIGQRRPRRPARRCSGATTIRLLSSLIALVRLTRTPCRVAKTMPQCLPQTAGCGAWLAGPGQRVPGGADRVDPVVLRSAGSLERRRPRRRPHRLRPGTRPGRRRSCRCLPAPRPAGPERAGRPRRASADSRRRRRRRHVCRGPAPVPVSRTARSIGVAVRVTSDDEVVVLCQHDHCGCPSIRGRSRTAPAWMKVTCRGSTVKGHAATADKLLIKPRRVGQVGAGNPRNRSNARHTQRRPVFSRVTSSCRHQPGSTTQPSRLKTHSVLVRPALPGLCGSAK